MEQKIKPKKLIKTLISERNNPQVYKVMSSLLWFKVEKKADFLKYFEGILYGENNFIRIHRSYLVNIHFAKRISRSDGAILVMEDNIELPVTNDKVELILSFFNFQKK